jgi:hypothetical protein
MRKFALGCILLVVATAELPAQSGWAEKMFDRKVTHEFGTVPRGAQLFHRFPITNIYAVRMEIVSVQSGCGCVSAEASKRVLEPRETAYIDVNMDGRRFTGSKAVMVRVTVGPEFVSTAELRVSAFCRADVVFNPGQVSFGSVPAGQPVSQAIDVEYAGALDWTVTEVLAKDLPVQTSLKQFRREPGQVGYRLEVTLKPDAPVGPLKQEIFLKTNDPASPLVPVLVEGVVQAAISVSPPVLGLGPVKVGETLTRRVVVRGSRPFVVRAIEGTGAGFDAGGPISETAALVHILTLKCKLEQPGQFKRELKIKTDLQDAPVIVTVTGEAAE